MKHPTIYKQHTKTNKQQRKQQQNQTSTQNINTTKQYHTPPKEGKIWICCQLAWCDKKVT